jgi:glycerol uptake facilitator-like aquaporin
LANNRFSRHARITAEFVGTAFLLMAVVGSGIMGERLAGGNLGIALLANTLATGPISGAHLNPAVTLADASQGGIRWTEVPGYVIAQILGAYLGVACAHLMFGLTLFSPSQHPRSGASQIFSEFIATFGLMAVIWGCSRLRPSVVSFAVGAHYRRVLVYGFHVVRQSSCHPGEGREPYVQRYSAS